MSNSANSRSNTSDTAAAPSPSPWASTWESVLAFGRLVRLSHTIFGLPFALASAALAHSYATEHGLEGLTLAKLFWIVLAFTGARAAAMGFNRVVDRHIDARNPRTQDRELPRGVISLNAATALTIASGVVFAFAAYAIGPLAGRLSLPCLGIVLSYSYFKRFSWTSHLMLGLALSLAPGGAWIAVTGGFGGWPVPLVLMAAVACWVAGFDVLYSLADEAFDREHGLHSIPARFGTNGALLVSAALHLGTAACLIALHVLAGLGGWHLLGLVVILGILVAEHVIVRPGDLSRLDKAFFDLNGYVSLAYLACVLLDVL